MNVGGVFLDRLRENGVDQADDRCIVLAFEQIRLLGQHLRQVRKVRRLIESLDCFHGLRAALVGCAQEFVKYRLRYALELHRDPQKAPRLSEGNWRCVRAARALRDAVLHALHEHAVALGKGEGQPPLRRFGEVARDTVHGLPASMLGGSGVGKNGFAGASEGVVAVAAGVVPEVCGARRERRCASAAFSFSAALVGAAD